MVQPELVDHDSLGVGHMQVGERRRQPSEVLSIEAERPDVIDYDDVAVFHRTAPGTSSIQLSQRYATFDTLPWSSRAATEPTITAFMPRQPGPAHERRG